MASKNVIYILGSSNKLITRRICSSNVKNGSKTSWEPKDIETHTGQTFKPDDRRLVRFINRPKEVNGQWAIDLIDQVSPEKAESKIVYCNGGGGPLGHPKVYINLDKPGNHICGYCGLRFYKDDHHH